MALTLVPNAAAKVGARFVYRGPNLGEECQGCPFQKLCFGLEAGRAYEVRALRGVTHPCGLHDEAKVQVVEVAEVDFAATLETRHLRGTAAHWAAPACLRPECPSYALCHPAGTASGARHAIREVGQKVACVAGFDLVQVRLQRMAEPA
ncbi:MAG TPA: UPF0179 family protein [Deinococcales bacterium]|nr:UPF0179 family protein [Deinococcales bacterium]